MKIQISGIVVSAVNYKASLRNTVKKCFWLMTNGKEVERIFEKSEWSFQE